MGDEADGQPAEYGLKLGELRDLMQYKGTDAIETIGKEYGGVLEMCKKLYTSPSEGKKFISLEFQASDIYYFRCFVITSQFFSFLLHLSFS